MILSPHQQAVFDVIVSAAKTTEPCPTDQDIADKIGHDVVGSIGKMIKALEDKGRIIRKRLSPHCRVIYVPGIGKTGPTRDQFRFKQLPVEAECDIAAELVAKRKLQTRLPFVYKITRYHEHPEHMIGLYNVAGKIMTAAEMIEKAKRL